MTRSRSTTQRCRVRNAVAVATLTSTGVVATLTSTAAHAQAPSVVGGGAPGLMTLLLNLVLVLGIIGVCAFLYSRGQSRFSVANGELNIVASRQVGNRERLVVLQVGDEQVLVGITANGINHLHTLTTPITASETTAVPFAQRLRQFSQSRTGGSDKT